MPGIQPSVSGLIRKKRDGHELSQEDIMLFVHLLSSGKVQDCQLGAMLMAMFIRGLTDDETICLTKELMLSGQVLTWRPEWHNVLVDKHSTGGVGDKVSIILVPVLAACGLKVPMISGRGLEFTGGTLDKLESIPGFRVHLSQEEFESCLNNVGCFIAGTTSSLCPAEKEMYKTRDVTSTVDYINLIVSSIISKKVASGIKNLVIDVKFGRATFCKDRASAAILAHQLVNVSAHLGVTTRAVLSQMDSVLGYSAGNALEIAECIECLRGKGEKQLIKLISVLGGNLLEMTNIAEDKNIAESMVLEVLENGKALKCFMSMLIQQGVDRDVANTLCYGNVWDILPRANHITQIQANKPGFITDVNGLNIGRVCWELGAGRRLATDRLDYSVGVKLLKKTSERVEKGEAWMELHHTKVLEPHILHVLETSIEIDNKCQENGSLIFDIIS